MKNAKYEIIQSELYSDEYGVCLGYNPKAEITPWVTWEFKAENNSYFWGHYFSNVKEARQDYHLRLYRNLGGYEK